MSDGDGETALTGGETPLEGTVKKGLVEFSIESEVQPASYYTGALRSGDGDFGRQRSSHVTMLWGRGGGLARSTGLCLTRLGVWFVTLANSIDDRIE